MSQNCIFYTYLNYAIKNFKFQINVKILCNDEIILHTTPRIDLLKLHVSI